MLASETIKTWKWRIVKAELSNNEFAEKVGISANLLSQYLTGATTPSIERFDEIEGKLKELGV